MDLEPKEKAVQSIPSITILLEPAQANFIVGFDNEKSPTVMYLSIPLAHVSQQGNLGLGMLIGQIELFRRQAEMVGNQMALRHQQSKSKIITPGVH